MRVVPTLVAAALLVLAGCASPEASPASASSSAAPFTVPPSESQRPGETSVKETLQLEGETRTDFQLGGCLNPRMLFVLDPADAQALLPPGFTAADVGELARFAGFGEPLPFATGRAVGGYDFLSCTSDTLGGASAAFSQVGILVQPPDLGNRTPVDPTIYDLYLLALHVNQPAWRDLAMRSGFTPEEAPLVQVTSQADDLAANQYLGSGSVVGDGPLADASYVLPSAGNTLDLRARYWHVAANGTFYIEFRLREDVRAGSISTCSHAAGSAYAKVAGTTTCATEPRFAAVGLDTEVGGTAYWIPGVLPKA